MKTGEIPSKTEFGRYVRNIIYFRGTVVEDYFCIWKAEPCHLKKFFSDELGAADYRPDVFKSVSMADKVQKFVRYQVDGVDSVLFGSWFGWFLLYERTQQVEALSAPPHVQFSAIIICAFIPSAEFCSYNSFKTSPAKSSVGMFLYALFSGL